jgi:alpha-soluble NSF attachment protein
MLNKCIECEQFPSTKANYMKDAALALRTQNQGQFIQKSREAIDLYCLTKRTSAAAALAKDCAEKLEEDYNYEDATTFYFKAAQIYQMERMPMQASSMSAKWADLSILSGEKIDFKKIADTYEQIGMKKLNDSMLKSGAKDVFFKSALVHLSNEDLVGAKRVMEKYCYEDPSFESSRQCKLLNSVVAACEQQDSVMFTRMV